MLYQSAHVTGIGRHTGTSMDRAVREAQRRAREDARGHRYVVVEENTDNVVAVAWPDGGVDYLDRPYPKISEANQEVP